MAKNLKAGEKVSVTREIHVSKNSPAYQQGLTSIKKGEIGEVVGPSQGRAVYVAFNGVQVSLTNQSLERLTQGQPSAQKKKKTQPARKSLAPRQVTKNATKQADVPAGIPTQSEKPAASEPDTASESDLQLITLVANRLLLKGKAKIDGETTIEVNLADLPEETKRQIQGLIDAKLSLKPKP